MPLFPHRNSHVLHTFALAQTARIVVVAGPRLGGIGDLGGAVKTVASGEPLACRLLAWHRRICN